MAARSGGPGLQHPAFDEVAFCVSARFEHQRTVHVLNRGLSSIPSGCKLPLVIGYFQPVTTYLDRRLLSGCPLGSPPISAIAASLTYRTPAWRSAAGV